MMRLPIFFLTLFLVLGSVGPLRAQEVAAPLIEIEFKSAEAIPGQPLSLRLTVLVPTWLSKPIVFPSFEAPNVMVRLPEGATGPVSRRIGGATWSGVSRHYRLSPMTPGVFSMPPHDVRVVWADPAGGPARQDVLSTPPISFSGVAPLGAEDLAPFVAAQKVTLTQMVTGADAPLKPGDSVTRTVTAEIYGAAPMFLPPLLPAKQIEGLAAYPAEPILSEQDQRGQLSGSRVESVTYIAESGGAATAPPVTLRWFNLETGAVESLSVEGFDLTVDGPSAASKTGLSARALAFAGLLGLCVLVPLVLGVRILRPRLTTYLDARKAAHLASESWAFGQVLRAVMARDFTALQTALNLWAARCPGTDPRRSPPLGPALTALGAAKFGRRPMPEDPAWIRLDAALQSAHDMAARKRSARSVLPPLNPAALP